ncbi:MAG: hypothetical protein ACOZCO_10600 [Bacteroidota bacterium]
MIRRVKKRFDIQISTSGESISKNFELDKSIVCIRGMLFTSDKDDLLFFRGSQRVEINKQEFFPEDYETKLLMTGVNVRPNARYYALGRVHPGNGIVRVEYKDTPDGRTTFAAYRVSLYLDCEMEDNQ